MDLTSPPSSAGHRQQLFITVRLPVEKFEPIFPQHNLKASRTSHMEPVCANRNKRRVWLYPTVSIYANSIQTYKCFLHSLVFHESQKPQENNLPGSPVSCRFTFWLTLFILLEGKNLHTVSSSWMSCCASEVFSKDKSENLSVSAHNLPESAVEMSWGPVISYFSCSYECGVTADK